MYAAMMATSASITNIVSQDRCMPDGVNAVIKPIGAGEIGARREQEPTLGGLLGRRLFPGKKQEREAENRQRPELNGANASDNRARRPARTGACST